MELSYHYLMLLNQSAYQKQVFDHLYEMELSIGQPKILDFLYEHNGCMQKEIAKGCMIEPASVTSILLKMEKDGYIDRVSEAGNRRSLYVHLTEKGLKSALKVREIMQETEEKALKALSFKERETLLHLLKRVNVGLLDDTYVKEQDV